MISWTALEWIGMVKGGPSKAEWDRFFNFVRTELCFRAFQFLQSWGAEGQLDSFSQTIFTARELARNGYGSMIHGSWGAIGGGPGMSGTHHIGMHSI